MRKDRLGIYWRNIDRTIVTASGSRAQQEEYEHDRVVALVAQQRFTYPNNEHPNWRTYLNKPEQTRAVQVANKTVYPDIVVINIENNSVEMLGEVETESIANSSEVAHWRDYSAVPNSAFYLYVPEETEDKAQQLLSSNSIPIAGLRKYRYDNADTVITNV